MTRRRLVAPIGAGLATALALAGGCAGEKREPPNLPLACETKQCLCVEAGTPIWRPGKQVPVEWKLTGDAFCPMGYVLRLADG